jgi:hypothetical protein
LPLQVGDDLGVRGAATVLGGDPDAERVLLAGHGEAPRA